MVPHRCDLIYSPKFSDELILRCWLKVYNDSCTLGRLLFWVILFEDGPERGVTRNIVAKKTFEANCSSGCS